MAKVSIIMPTYNVEKYFKQCLESVINQTLDDIEIIPVDDGSPDNCGQIMDEYAAKDSRIKPIHQKNGGYGKAVNAGIEAATGEYIGIVETDDFIDLNMYEELYKAAKEYNVDVVKGDYKEVFEYDGGVYTRLAYPSRFMNPAKNPFNILEYTMPLNHHASIWAGIYRTSFIKEKNIRVLEINKGRYADQNWRYETLLQAKSIYWVKTPFYNYRPVIGNASSKKADNPDDIFDLYIELKKFYDKHPELFEKTKDCLYAEIYRHMKWNIVRVDEKYFDYCLQRIVEQFGYLDKEVIKNTSILNRTEKKEFLSMLKGKYKFYYQVQKFIKLIFSITNTDDKKYKIITIFGLSINIPRKHIKH